ncbi:phosphate transporter PHO1 homolog 10-like [Neltuma alba]|uniref:phosphate transporter PHO1 homolog 10-like n=1 Tax=Neltuma alba TaxID=207710 RepID=UPI0010A3EB6B|nr:phosphate transporter PHO1 homolog 10-like [Prosopis alba]
MTFKRDFKEQMVHEWAGNYMDYEGLKKILKEIKSSKPGQNNQKPPHKSLRHMLSFERGFSGLHLEHSNHGRIEGDIEEHQVIDVKKLQQDGSSRKLYKTHFRKSHEEGEAEVRLFQKLDEELNKVNSFFKEQVEALEHEENLLKKQMEALIALRATVKNPDIEMQNLSSSPAEKMDHDCQRKDMDVTNGNANHDGEEGRSNYNRRDPLEILDQVKIDNTIEASTSAIRSVFTGFKQEESSFSKEDLRKVEKQLRLVFVEFYQKLLNLKNYSFMNLSAFSTIMEKYEKTTTRAASRAFMREVDNSYIGTSDEVTCMLERVESTFTRNFARSNHKKGRKLLRPKSNREKHSITFLTGFFSGCFVALLAATLTRIISQNLMKQKQGSFYLQNIFPLYSLFGFITLHMLMYAVDAYFWRRYRVNYPFIFGFKPGTELGCREVFLLSTGLAVLALLGFLVNLQLEMNPKTQSHRKAAEIVPLSLLMLVLLITFCPFDIIFRSSRFFFMKCLFRSICVRLPDFFFADQITSQVQAFRNFELYICYYGLGEHSRRQEKCQSRGVYNTLSFIIGVIPFWFRLSQCMRQLYDEGDIIRAWHGLNYLFTILALLSRTAFELKKGVTWKVLALITSSVTVIQNTYWDIFVDWGLLRRHSRNPYLRDKLLLPHKCVYFIAMGLDVLLRLIWMQSVLQLTWRPLQKVAMTTVIGCLEIIRRGIWNFFRLENEYLNNVGKYRPFKSVPLPFSYYKEDNEEDNNKDE